MSRAGRNWELENGARLPGTSAEQMKLLKMQRASDGCDEHDRDDPDCVKCCPQLQAVADRRLGGIAAQVAYQNVSPLTFQVNTAYLKSMDVKTDVFRAQDAVSLAWEPATYEERKLLRKMEKRLAKVRSELEQLDNDYLALVAKVRR